MDYGYEGKVALPIRLTLAKDLASKKVHLTANVNWLVCREVCIPGNALLGFDYIVEPELFDAPKGGVGSWLGISTTRFPYVRGAESTQESAR